MQPVHRCVVRSRKYGIYIFSMCLFGMELTADTMSLLTCSNQIHDLLKMFKKKTPYFILHLPEISTSSVIHMFGSHINQKFTRTTYHNRAIFCACYASTFYKILDLTTAAALKTVTFFNQVFICPLRPVLFKNHRIR